MKKLFACMMAIMLFAISCIPARAAETEPKVNYDQEGNSIAFLVIDATTTSAEREQILEARKEIIYSKSWVADGLSGCILDANGKVKEVLPQFSEIFPEDWAEPVEEITITAPVATAKAEPYYDWNSFYKGPVTLKIPSDKNTNPFCSLSTTAFAGTYNEYRVTEVITSGVRSNPTAYGKFNVGYSNLKTGASLGYAVNLNNGEALSIKPPANISLGVRASSYDSAGVWQMRVDGKRVFPLK